MPTPYGEFVPDPLSPSGYRWKRHDEPEPTGLLPAVNPAVEQPAQLPAVEHNGPELPGGDWANADAYASYDEVDSLTILDEGAPS